jgi:hypothetical protein
MKLSSIVCASIVTLVAAGLITDDASAAVTSASTRSNSQHNSMVGPRLTCPTGEVVSTNPTTGKQSCVQPDMAVKNSGVPKNTTIVTAPKGKSTDSTTPQ